eukprot:1093893_1
MSSGNRLSRILGQLSYNNCGNSNGIQNKVAVIMGAGDGLGRSIAKKFASKGFIVVVARRTQAKVVPLVNEINAQYKDQCYGFGVDCRKENQIIDFIGTVESTYGPIECAIFNVGANVRFDICDTTSRVYYKVWQMACFGGFLFSKEVATYMKKRRRGCILFSGATASIRGKQGFAAFSGAKHALRALAQSMAKELGPIGIHIAHIVIDGGIDSPFTRDLFKKMGMKLDKPDMLLNPDEIADNYWHLYQQQRNAWTFEMDLRPYTEQWT